MQPTPYIWKNGNLIPWEDATTHLLTHSLHYAGSAWEGIRCYETPNGPAIFRLKEHMDRLTYSANALKFDVPFTQEELTEAVIHTVRENNLTSGYIRPLIYLGYGKMGLKTNDLPVEVMIACWPWGKYLAADGINVKISDFIRIHPKSTIADAKIGGHYANSIIAGLDLKGTNYQETLLLDYEGNVAEGPGANIFIVKKGELYTPPPGAILPGITRATLLTLAQDLGIPAHEISLSPDDLDHADEAFFCGTAAEVTPIRSINTTNYGDPGPITLKLQLAYLDLVQGKSNKHKDFLTFI